MASTLMVLAFVVALGGCLTEASTIRGGKNYLRNRRPSDAAMQLIQNQFNLEYYGDYEGKSYYAGLTRVEFEYADNFCQSIGMDLVAIETEGERDYLLANTRQGIFWTSGRIQNTAHWATGNKEITVNVNDYVPSYSYVVFYASDSIDLARGNANYMAYPLCQK